MGALLALGNAHLGFQFAHLAVGRFNFLGQFLAHQTHFFGVLLGPLISRLQLGQLGRGLLFIAQKFAGVAIIASAHCGLGILGIFSHVRLSVGQLAALGHFLGNHGGGFALQLVQIAPGVGNIFFQQLISIFCFRLAQHGINIGRHNIGKTSNNVWHSLNLQF